MYTGDHAHIKICRVCGNTLTPPSKGGCHICWHGTERGLLISDPQIGVWVHQSCLDFFDVDSVVEYEREYID